MYSKKELKNQRLNFLHDKIERINKKPLKKKIKTRLGLYLRSSKR